MRLKEVEDRRSEVRKKVVVTSSVRLVVTSPKNVDVRSVTSSRTWMSLPQKEAPT
jgi:hypothetical protein